MLPIHPHALFGPLCSPPLQNLFGGRLALTLHEIHAPPQSLLDPVLALVLSALASIHPQMTETRK
jgi:hypothetical protein